jgi:hypothetical protein
VAESTVFGVGAGLAAPLADGTTGAVAATVLLLLLLVNVDMVVRADGKRLVLLCVTWGKNV